jgi:hypothetical protein
VTAPDTARDTLAAIIDDAMHAAGGNHDKIVPTTADAIIAAGWVPTTTLPQDAGDRTGTDNTPAEAALLAAEGAVESGFTRTSLDWLELQPTSPRCSNPRCFRRYGHDWPCLALAASPAPPKSAR